MVFSLVFQEKFVLWGHLLGKANCIILLNGVWFFSRFCFCFQFSFSGQATILNLYDYWVKWLLSLWWVSGLMFECFVWINLKLVWCLTWDFEFSLLSFQPLFTPLNGICVVLLAKTLISSPHLDKISGPISIKLKLPLQGN